MSQLQEFGPNIWLCNGPTITAAAGFHYPTRMVVIRLRNGDLFVWSPVQFCEGLRNSVDALGRVACIVAQNDLHDSFLSQWSDAFPDAKLYGAPGLPDKRQDLQFAQTLNENAPDIWAGEIEQVVFDTNRITKEVVFFHLDSRTVVFTDLLQHLPHGWYRGWRALVARLDLMTGPEPQVPRKFRVAFRDKPSVRSNLRRVLGWPVERLVIAHGAPVIQDAKGVLERAFAWLKP